VRAAAEFALPQIEIVGPRLAVCLGKAAFDAVAVAAGRRGAKLLADAIACPFELGKTQVWCQAHTGQQGTNVRNRDGVDRVTSDWARMSAAYKAKALDRSGVACTR
jgi:restriction system protein